jgi:uncharacterized protein YgbK (DUF1537 family)
MILGIVADDITGANDIGIMVAKAGYLTHVYQGTADGGRRTADGRRWTMDGGRQTANGGRQTGEGGLSAHVCILNTDSRLDAPEVAYGKVFAATQSLQQLGCRQFFNKTCSVFRGNIGPEFDAMLDALGYDFAPVVLGFPKNGRTTHDGLHYVHGQLLADSAFRHDPVQPTRESNLVTILQSQTKRRVGLIDHEVIGRGAGALRSRLEALRGQYQYVILDVTSQADLATIATAVHDFPILCGSSALAEELPAVWQRAAAWQRASPAPPPVALPAENGVGILVVAGSLTPQTAAQVAHLEALGVPVYCLNSLAVFEAAERQAEVARLVTAVAGPLAAGQDALFFAGNDPARVAQTQDEGARRGLDRSQVSRLVSAALAEATGEIVTRTGANRLAAAGGETAAAVCERLGITGLRVWQEIQSGLPSCLSLTPPTRLLILKSGSFGSPDFLEVALDYLKEILI